MKILVIGAMRVEIEFILEKLDNLLERKINNYTFYLGKLFNKDIILVESGIGKVMSGVLLATAYNSFENIDYVINIGVAGGYNNVNIGDIVVGDKYIFGDADATAFPKYRFGQIPGFPFPFKASEFLLEKALKFDSHKGTICTMDRFVSNDEFIKPFIENYFTDFDILCFDMETTAFAQAAHFYNLEFLAIRAISDIVGSKEVEKSYDHNLDLACLNSNTFLLNLLQSF